MGGRNPVSWLRASASQPEAAQPSQPFPQPLHGWGSLQVLSSLYHVLEVTRGLVVAVRWQRLEGEARSVTLYIYLSGQVGPCLGLAQGTGQGRVC